MRGTPAVRVCGVSLPGIIPAYAGNTLKSCAIILPPWDHPRVCGEHRDLRSSGRRAQGSSPRMRGTQVPAKQGVLPFGIIPAYAGNTCWTRYYRRIVGDHPRVCGEHKFRRSKGFFCSGSSPRMRGTPSLPFHDHEIVGIIPAYAGNTRTPSRKSTTGRDHPRVCGEHCWIELMSVPILGSSPRMRGTPV